VFDAYRNMFLALEAVLDHIAPKKPGESETEWLGRAVTDAVQRHAADLAAFVRTSGKDPVEAFIGAHYAAVRCAAPCTTRNRREAGRSDPEHSPIT
jgi:hypothetical protein